MAPAPELGVGSAMAIDGRGKVAARFTAACEEEASPSWVARMDGEGEVVGAAAVMAIVVATAAVAVAAVSVVSRCFGQVDASDSKRGYLC